MRKYLSHSSLCPSAPLLSCSGVCWVNSLQAGLVGRPVRSFHRLCQLCGKTRTVFLESACFHLGTPTFVSAAKQSICSRNYFVCFSSCLQPQLSVVVLSFWVIFGSQGTSCSLCNVPNKWMLGIEETTRKFALGESVEHRKWNLISVCWKNTISLRKKLCWFY